MKCMDLSSWSLTVILPKLTSLIAQTFLQGKTHTFVHFHILNLSQKAL
jgi:hypothetical protein